MRRLYYEEGKSLSANRNFGIFLSIRMMWNAFIWYFADIDSIRNGYKPNNSQMFILCVDTKKTKCLPNSTHIFFHLRPYKSAFSHLTNKCRTALSRIEFDELMLLFTSVHMQIKLWSKWACPRWTFSRIKNILDFVYYDATYIRTDIYRCFWAGSNISITELKKKYIIGWKC